MVDKKEEFYQRMTEKKEIMQIMRVGIKDNWLRMVNSSKKKKTDSIHEYRAWETENCQSVQSFLANLQFA